MRKKKKKSNGGGLVQRGKTEGWRIGDVTRWKKGPRLSVTGGGWEVAARKNAKRLG